MYVQNKQSDQLGRIFAYWAIVSLVGHFLKKLQKETKNLGLLFSTEKSYVCINFDKNGLGHIFGDFFTNSSCHPENKHTGDAHTYIQRNCSSGNPIHNYILFSSTVFCSVGFRIILERCYDFYFFFAEKYGVFN
jgi:hypothetical protein